MSVRQKGYDLFATHGDYQVLFDSIEAASEWKFVQCGMFPTSDLPTYDSFRDIPDFAVAFRGQAVQEKFFLILPRNAEVIVTPVPQKTGGILYTLEQHLNPDSMSLFPGGLYADGSIIKGETGTVSFTPGAEAIYSAFKREVVRRFYRYGGYYIGKEAFQRFREGARLTPDVRLDLKFDYSRWLIVSEEGLVAPKR